MVATRPPDPRRVLHADDSRDSDRRRNRGAIAPAGQLVIPGTIGAQLGLDGLSYDVGSAPSRDAASSSLGTPHGLLHSPEESQPCIANVPQQLALDLEQWNASKQLTLWERLAVQRDLVRWGDWDRDAKCHHVRFLREADVRLTRTDLGTWAMEGVVLCGKMHCPACGVSRARETATALGACFEAHRSRTDVAADVWMLSPTIPHDLFESASVVVEQLYAAYADFLRSKEWKAFRREWGLETNGVRVLDIVHGGANGMHPHFHSALFPTKAELGTHEEWRVELELQRPSDAETGATITTAGDDPLLSFFSTTWRETDVALLPTSLADKLRKFGPLRKLAHCSDAVRAKYLAEIRAPLVVAWERAVRKVGVKIANVEQFRAHALKLSPSEDAHTYFTKWGLQDEVGKPTSKDRSHLRLLDAVAAGVPGAAYTWKQFRAAVDGRTWITGLADTCNKLGVDDEAIDAWGKEWQRRREVELAKQGTPVERVRKLALYVRAHLWQTAISIGWGDVFAYLDAFAKRETDDDALQRELDFYLNARKQLDRDRQREAVRNADSS